MYFRYFLHRYCQKEINYKNSSKSNVYRVGHAYVAYGISNIYKDVEWGKCSVHKMKEIVCKGGYPTMKRFEITMHLRCSSILHQILELVPCWSQRTAVILAKGSS